MVFNATFNNISAISWQSVLLVEETWVPRENHWPVAQSFTHDAFSLYVHFTPTFYGNSSKLCMLAYYHMKIRILLQELSWSWSFMVVGFTTTYAISAYHHEHFEFDFTCDIPCMYYIGATCILFIILLHGHIIHIALPQCCACPKLAPGFPSANVVVFLCSMIWDEWWLYM
jgi:hypothetical protein